MVLCVRNKDGRFSVFRDQMVKRSDVTCKLLSRKLLSFKRYLFVFTDTYEVTS